jgi:hypothetical protein
MGYRKVGYFEHLFYIFRGKCAMERNMAMIQLAEHDIPFGGVAPDVVKVVRCRDCARGDNSDCSVGKVWCSRMCRYMNEDGYCSLGERRTE